MDEILTDLEVIIIITNQKINWYFSLIVRKILKRSMKA